MRHLLIATSLLAAIGAAFVSGDAQALTTNVTLSGHPTASTNEQTFASTTAPAVSSTSIVQAAPAVTQSSTGGTATGSSSAGTPTAPVRNFEKGIGKGGGFGNSWFGATYGAGASFFGGRKVTLRSIVHCREPVLTGNPDLDDGALADYEACLDRAVSIVDDLYTACDAANLGGIEYCLGSATFCSQNDCSGVSMDVEDRIVEARGFVKADAKLVGVSASLVDIQLSARASSKQAPKPSIHFFIRSFDSYDSPTTATAGTIVHDKTETKELWSQSKTFMVGGVVPIKLDAEAWADFGITSSATAYPNSAAVGLTPHARVYVVGRATLNAGLYAGGVQATLDLLTIEAPVTASLARYAGTSSDRYNYRLDADLVLGTMSGKVELFGKPVWRSQYDYLKLVEWQGFSQTFNLYHQSGDAYVVRPL